MTSPDATVAFYDRHAGDLASLYEALSPDAVWSSIADLLPTGPDRLALDVGAGSGRDAAWLAARGLEVVAAEPAAGMRREAVHRIGLAFDLVLVGAVWMHVPPPATTAWPSSAPSPRLKPPHGVFTVSATTLDDDGAVCAAAGRSGGAHRERQKDREGDQHRPDRHVQAEHGAAGIRMAGTGDDVEQHLAHRHHQEEQRPYETDADVAPVVAVADVADGTETDAEHRDTLEETQRARDLAIRVLKDHRRGEDRRKSRQDREHDEIDQPRRERGSAVHAGSPP